MMKRFGIFAGLALATVMAAPSRSEALVVTDAFLFSDWTQPVNESAPPFNFTPTDGVSLGLNGSGVATSFADVGAVGPFSINNTVAYDSHTLNINVGEGFAQTAVSMGPRVNSEIGTLDDVGFIDEGGDAELNVDFSDSGSTVTFALPAQGIDRLMIAEDAGLDAFKLDLCSDAACTTPKTLFDGMDDPTRDGILARADFDVCDFSTECAIDQVYLFVFDSSATGFIRISETGNFGTPEESATLEIDFIGNAVPRSVVPEPASVLLLGFGGLGALGLTKPRGRNSRKA